MAGDRRSSRSGSSGRTRSPQNGRGERPFDVWLNRQLHTMYDDIAREPIPREVIELIERDARGTKPVDEPEVPPPAVSKDEQD